MILIKYEGRHGNFIFQYIFARYLSFLTNQIIKDENLFYKYTGNRLIKFTVNDANNNTDYKESIIVDDKNVLDIINNIDLLKDKNIQIGGRNGYYQNADIYLANQDFIKSILNYNDEELEIKENSVLIHIRLDDFHRNGNDSEIISFSYYDNILKLHGKNRFKNVYVLYDLSTIKTSFYKKRIINKIGIDYSDYENKYLNYFKEKYNAELISSNYENDFKFFKYFNNIILSASTFGFWGVCNINRKCNVYVPIHKQAQATSISYKILQWLGHNVETYNKIKFINFNEENINIGEIYPSAEGYVTKTKNNNNTITTTLYLSHHVPVAGFFSNCSMALYGLAKYYKHTKTMPDKVNMSLLFQMYKKGAIMIDNDTNSLCKILFLEDCICKSCNPNIKNLDGSWSGRYTHNCPKSREYDKNIAPYYFSPYKKPNEYNYNISDFAHWSQFYPYTDTLIENIKPFFKSLFSPSENILSIIEIIKEKYNIDYDNTCVLFLRGGDKQRETTIPTYDDYIKKLNNDIEEHEHYKNLRYLVQSDETEFIDEMKKIFTNSFSFKEEIRTVPKAKKGQPDLGGGDNLKYSQFFLAILIIMSKCKYVYCNTGNCSLWIRLYRESKEGFNQWIGNGIQWKKNSMWL